MCLTSRYLNSDMTCVLYIIQVTNLSGIKWLQQHLGDDYNFHTIFFENDAMAMHLDASILIPKPGVVVFNTERKSNKRDFFEKAGWKVL